MSSLFCGYVQNNLQLRESAKYRAGPRAHPGSIRAIAAGVKHYLQASANLR
jgi:hypothetical protein